MAANPYWIDDRLRSQRVAGRTVSVFPTAREISRELVGDRAEVRRRGGLVPSWVVFTMIFLATFALSVSVSMRTRAEATAAGDHYQKMYSDVQQLRESNAVLEQEIRRLNSDPRAIETAARARLNMVRANEIVVPAK